MHIEIYWFHTKTQMIYYSSWITVKSYQFDLFEKIWSLLRLSPLWSGSFVKFFIYKTEKFSKRKFLTNKNFLEEFFRRNFPCFYLREFQKRTLKLNRMKGFFLPKLKKKSWEKGFKEFDILRLQKNSWKSSQKTFFESKNFFERRNFHFFFFAKIIFKNPSRPDPKIK